jgi:hypothetical protein
MKWNLIRKTLIGGLAIIALSGHAVSASNEATNSASKVLSATVASPVATYELSGQPVLGQRLYVTNRLDYTGTLISLVWRPQLPSGWTIASVSVGSEMVAGDIVLLESRPANPTIMVYALDSVIGASPLAIVTEVEYQLMGMINPATIYSIPANTPKPLKLNTPVRVTGRLQCIIEGVASSSIKIQGSTNLPAWFDIETVMLSSQGVFTYLAPDLGKNGFIRAVQNQ